MSSTEHNVRYRRACAARTSPGVKQAAMERALERLRAELEDRSLKMSKVRESIARAALA